jgi:DNA-3-methyladenine glycosylase I
MGGKRRCAWAGSDPLYVAYHDDEWGIPEHDEIRLFEMLILEGAQAGLSWLTILKKRENYRRAYAGFDPARVARFDRRKVESLMRDEGIVRNRLKIEGSVTNAREYTRIQDEFGGFDPFVWRFVGGNPRVNAWKTIDQVPATTPESDAMSKELKGRGMKFVGSTICYAFIQAVGMVNDHTTDCAWYARASHKRRGSG